MEGKTSRLPPGPNYFVGVAGLVLDVHSGTRGRVLVVQEKSGPAAGINMWKLPGGLVDAKEDIAVAAAREVLEETGVPARFERLMTIQENHQVRGPGREGSTDLFCVCLLTPTLSQDGRVPDPVMHAHPCTRTRARAHAHARAPPSEKSRATACLCGNVSFSLSLSLSPPLVPPPLSLSLSIYLSVPPSLSLSLCLFLRA